MRILKYKLVLILLLIAWPLFSQSGWIRQQSGTTALIMNVWFINEYTGWSVGDSSYVLKTTNGGQSWIKTKVNNSKRIILRFVKFQNPNTGYIGGGDEASNIYGKRYLYKTTNQGQNWMLMKSDSSYGDVYYSSISIVNPNRFFISTEISADMISYGYIEKSNDGGITFSSTGSFNGSPNCLSFISELTGWICTSASSDIANQNRSFIYRTTNSGVSWDSLLCDSVHYNYISRISFINSMTGFALSLFFRSGYESTRFYKTTNGGINWDTTGYRSFQKYYALSAIDENTVYVGGSSGSDTTSIARTTNRGTTWSAQYKGYSEYILDFCFLNSATGYAVGSNGLILKTTSGGETFIKTMSTEVPEKFELGQNYPNPFNQSTIFNLQCSMKGNVSVKVFDAAGREVQTLVNETLAPGTYQVRFDGSGLASGLYYYSMSIDGKQTAVKKMIMVK